MAPMRRAKRPRGRSPMTGLPPMAPPLPVITEAELQDYFARLAREVGMESSTPSEQGEPEAERVQDTDESESSEDEQSAESNESTESTEPEDVTETSEGGGSLSGRNRRGAVRGRRVGRQGGQMNTRRKAVSLGAAGLALCMCVTLGACEGQLPEPVQATASASASPNLTTEQEKAIRKQLLEAH